MSYYTDFENKIRSMSDAEFNRINPNELDDFERSLCRAEDEWREELAMKRSFAFQKKKEIQRQANLTQAEKEAEETDRIKKAKKRAELDTKYNKYKRKRNWVIIRAIIIMILVIFLILLGLAYIGYEPTPSNQWEMRYK